MWPAIAAVVPVMGTVLLALLALAGGAANASDPATEPQAATSVPATGPATRQWPLPLCRQVQPASLEASLDGRLAVFGEVRTGDANLPDCPPPKVVYWLLDANSGVLTDVASLLTGADANGLMAFAHLSPDGRHLAVGVGTLVPKPAFRAYLVSLEGRKVRRVAEAPMLLAAWAGPALAIGSTDAEGQMQPIQLINPQDDRMKELPLRGRVAAGDASGNVLACYCDPESPTKPFRLGDAVRGRLAVINSAGKVLRDLGPCGAGEDCPAVSPNGKFVAFENGQSSQDGQPPQNNVTVVPLGGGAPWSINQPETPLAVTDDGRLITRDAVDGQALATVKIWPAGGGEARTLTDSAQAAAVAGASLLQIISQDAGLMLNAAPLDSNE